MADMPAALLQQGLALHRAGRLAEAEAAYREVLAQQPQNAEALHLYGVLAYQAKQPALAIEYFGRAIRLRSDQASYYSNAALALSDLGRAEEAEAACRTALRLQPGFGEAQNNLGLVLRTAGRLDKAEACFRDVLRRQPGSVQALNNLGTTLLQLRRHDEAAAVLRAALAGAGDGPHRHSIAYNLAQALLALGRFEEGWLLYESRPTLTAAPRSFEAPLWDGRPMAGGTLLLHAEQGLGDTLQFCRFAPLAAPGARIVLEVQPPLQQLLTTLPGVAQVVAQGNALPPHDAQYPLMSLPHRLGIKLDTIPATIPYLHSDPAAIQAWDHRLSALGGTARIGLVWAGAPYRPETPGLAAMDRRRSLDLASLAPLGDVRNAVFVSLQKGEAGRQTGLALHDFTAELNDFADTAALVSALDLVIGVDTSVIHLAGALGKPVWVLDRHDGCWRWLTGRTDSPWYPTLRLFRQPSAGDWTSVIAAARDALAARLNRRHPDMTPTAES